MRGPWCAHSNSAQPRRKQQVHLPGCRGADIVERNQEELDANISQLRATTFSSQVKRADALRSSGVGKLHCAMDYIPGARATIDLKHDIMHLFFCGISPKESFQMLEHFTSNKVFTWAELNASRKKVKVANGHAIPELVRPKTDGKTKKSIGMVMTAATCMHWMVNRCALASRALASCATRKRAVCRSQQRRD